jgi:Zn-dependent protease with chaperone function
MTVALALLASAAVASWLAPGVLGRIDLRRADPLLAVVCWLLLVVGVIATATTGIVLLLVPGHGMGSPVLAAVHHCWSEISHGSPPRVEEVAGTLGVGLLLVLAARFARIGLRQARRRAGLRREYLALVRLAARCDEGHPTTLWLAHDQPLAFSLAGRPGVIVATDGLARHLSEAEVDAVLAHERAHLRGRHHLVVSTMEALAASLPWVPLFRRALAALRELVELVADIAAVRLCGAAAVRAALLTINGPEAPEGSLAMAGDAVPLRLARLDRVPDPRPGWRRAVSCSLAGVTALTLPLLVGAVVLALLGLLSCPLLFPIG